MNAVRKYIGTIDVTEGTEVLQRGGSNRGRRVCIVGGGIGGLTAALAFARSGASVEVYEQAPALTEIGAGLQITPNGARALEALGLGAELDAVGLRGRAVQPMDALSGKVITRLELSHMAGPPYRFFHRADLIDVLARACRTAGVGIQLGSRVNSSDLSADLVIGAEGVRSDTRGVLNGFAEPFFTGQVAWRAIVDAPEEPIAQAAIACIWMAPRRHVVTYPLSGNRLNIVAVQERDTWAAEGWAHEDDPRHLRAAFHDVAPRLQGILDRVDQVHLWGLFRHDVARVWAKHNLVILGDAAHPTLPFLAQGANLAIEDAFVLARCCDAGDIGRALKKYEDVRKSRVHRAIDAANANARNYHLSGIRRRVAHTGLKTIGFMAPNAFLKRMSWLYDYDVTAGDIF